MNPTRNRPAGRLSPLAGPLLLAALAAPVFAAPPAVGPATRAGEKARPAGRKKQADLPPWLGRLEIVQMLSSITSGSRMGPGGGWFHPGQSRYGWDWLAGRFDADGNGSVTPKELGGLEDLFDRLDRDGSGAIRKDDFDWSADSDYFRESAMLKQWFGRVDSGSNGRVSREEWEEFFRRAAKGKDSLTPEALREALTRASRPKKGAPARRGPDPKMLFAGLFRGDLGSFFHGPGIGDRAPSFTLKTPDGKRSYTLSDFRGKKPVVLIFGSFT